jgi:hypothetical protein
MKREFVGNRNGAERGHGGTFVRFPPPNRPFPHFSADPKIRDLSFGSCLPPAEPGRVEVLSDGRWTATSPPPPARLDFALETAYDDFLQRRNWSKNMTVTILPVPNTEGELSFHAVSGNKSSLGKTPGEASGEICARTDIGRATIDQLKMNGEAQKTARRQWARLSLFP